MALRIRTAYLLDRQNSSHTPHSLYLLLYGAESFIMLAKVPEPSSPALASVLLS